MDWLLGVTRIFPLPPVIDELTVLALNCRNADNAAIYFKSGAINGKLICH